MSNSIILTIITYFFTALGSCQHINNQILNKNMEENINQKLIVKIKDKTFEATLLENPTVTSFKALLPLDLDMIELNDNEKYANLPKSLPTDASVPKHIQKGDLMMYGSNTIVLFYKDFITSYKYTKIGKIDDIQGLESALGKSNIGVSFRF
jgi:hypothetical protein